LREDLEWSNMSGAEAADEVVDCARRARWAFGIAHEGWVREVGSVGKRLWDRRASALQEEKLLVKVVRKDGPLRDSRFRSGALPMQARLGKEAPRHKVRYAASSRE